MKRVIFHLMSLCRRTLTLEWRTSQCLIVDQRRITTPAWGKLLLKECKGGTTDLQGKAATPGHAWISGQNIKNPKQLQHGAEEITVFDQLGWLPQPSCRVHVEPCHLLRVEHIQRVASMHCWRGYNTQQFLSSSTLVSTHGWHERENNPIHGEENSYVAASGIYTSSCSSL